MNETAVKHRDNFGHRYKGINVHSAPGLHELVHTLAGEFFDLNQPIVELGAGSGALSLRLMESGFEVVPLDLDGNDWRPPIKLIECDLNDEGWWKNCPDIQFQQIIAVEVIEHLENPTKFFRDMSKLLIDDGTLIITTPNVVSFHSIYATWKRGVFSCFSPADFFESGHISILPWWLLRVLANRHSFRVIRCLGACDIEEKNSLRHFFVKLITRIRRFFFKPYDFEFPEGLSTVLVLKKGHIPRTKS